MPTKSKNRAALLGLIALAAMLVAGGGIALLLGQSPQPVSKPSPSGPTTGQLAALSAEAGDTVVTLTWQPMQGAAGYFVHRDGGRDPLNPRPIMKTMYQDIGLSNGRTYTYTIVPVVGGTEGQRLPAVQVVPNPK